MIRRILLLSLLALPLAAADISGSWTFEVEIAGMTGRPSFKFVQKGEELTGEYSGQLGQAKLKGTVKGDAVEFQFQAGEYPVSYAGKLENDRLMKGKLDIAGQAEGTFVGKKD